MKVKMLKAGSALCAVNGNNDLNVFVVGKNRRELVGDLVKGEISIDNFINELGGMYQIENNNRVSKVSLLKEINDYIVMVRM